MSCFEFAVCLIPKKMCVRRGAKVVVKELRRCPLEKVWVRLSKENF